MEDITKKQIEAMLKNVKANYKYTQLTNDFISKVLGKLYMINVIGLTGIGIEKPIINPTKDSKIVIRKGWIYPVLEMRILQNDFELTDKEGCLDDELSRQWQEGMIKRALPLYDKVNNIDAKHYLADLRVYEFDKMANRVNSLCDMLAMREAEEQD